MATYSKEWIKRKKLSGFPKKTIKSIEKTFQDLEYGESIDFKCDGFKISKIKNIDNECIVVIDNNDVSLEDKFGLEYHVKDNVIRNALRLGFIILILWGASWWLMMVNFDTTNQDGRGTFGDMFGSVNSLFSGLALGGIIFTIYLQRSELRLQRKELKDTRKEFSKQNETMSLQKFETTFFNILRNHSELLESVPIKGRSSSENNVNKYTAIKDLQQNTKYLIEELFNIIESKKINNYYNQYTIDKIKEKSEDFDSIANSINIIIKFINTNSDFYYDLLLNSMSFSEKYLFGFYLEFNYIENNLNDSLLAKFKEIYYSFNSIKKEDNLPPQLIIGITHKKENLDLLSIQTIINELKIGITNNDNNIIEISSITINKIDRSGKFEQELQKRDCQTTVEPNKKINLDADVNINVKHVLQEEGSVFRLNIVISLRKRGEDIYEAHQNLYIGQLIKGYYSIQQ